MHRSPFISVARRLWCSSTVACTLNLHAAVGVRETRRFASFGALVGSRALRAHGGLVAHRPRERPGSTSTGRGALAAVAAPRRRHDFRRRRGAGRKALSGIGARVDGGGAVRATSVRGGRRRRATSRRRNFFFASSADDLRESRLLRDADAGLRERRGRSSAPRPATCRGRREGGRGARALPDVEAEVASASVAMGGRRLGGRAAAGGAGPPAAGRSPGRGRRHAAEGAPPRASIEDVSNLHAHLLLRHAVISGSAVPHGLRVKALTAHGGSCIPPVFHARRAPRCRRAGSFFRSPPPSKKRASGIPPQGRGERVVESMLDRRRSDASPVLLRPLRARIARISPNKVGTPLGGASPRAGSSCSVLMRRRRRPRCAISRAR